jgi:hypothetical protein
MSPVFFRWLSVLHLTLLITLSFSIISKLVSVSHALSWFGFTLICLVEPSWFVLVITLPLQFLYPLESLMAQFLAHFFSLFTLHPTAHICSTYSVNQRQYVDDNQCVITLSPSNIACLSSNRESCLSSFHSWFCLNGLF